MAISWTSKDPDEIDNRQHDFAGLLDAGETVASYDIAKIAGTVVAAKRPVAPADTSAVVDISGGVDGETSVFDVTLVTSAGRTLNETIILPVVSTAVSGLVTTGYVAPTAANLKAMFPIFAAVDLATIQFALDEAATQVDISWTEDTFALGRLLYAAHVLTMNGHGAGAAAQISGLNGVRRMKSGALDVEFADKGKSGAYSVLMSTSFGERYLRLLRQNKAGPRTTGALNGCVAFPFGHC